VLFSKNKNETLLLKREYIEKLDAQEKKESIEKVNNLEKTINDNIIDKKEKENTLLK
jgi:hypothetical protein